MSFKEKMVKLGAREFQAEVLAGDEDRAMSAIAVAQSRGVENVIPYALKLFEDTSWAPKGVGKPRLTNLSVDRACIHCGGDRFVPVTDDVNELYGETFAPCIYCNKDANTSRWVGAEKRETAPR